MAKNRFFVDKDAASGIWVIVPDMYRQPWREWQVRDESRRNEDPPFFARVISSPSDVTFVDPKFLRHGTAGNAEWL